MKNKEKTPRAIDQKNISISKSRGRSSKREIHDKENVSNQKPKVQSNSL